MTTHPRLLPDVTTNHLTGTMKTALLTEQTRARAVGQLSDALRTRGYQHADVVQLTQEVYREAGKPVPDLAEVDAWLDESEVLR